MKILAFGDIVGKAGRRAIFRSLPKIRESFQPDFTIANAENAAGGFGLTKKVYLELVQKCKIDCLTMGNHWHDKREIHQFHEQYENIVLPANMMNVDNLEHGFSIFETPKGRLAIINLIGRAFMHADNRCPFAAADQLLQRIPESVTIRIIDMHAEATSEKQGLAHYLSGQISLLFGTHTHVPTADERILDGKTGYISDIGMNGAYDSVVGIRKEASIQRLITGTRQKFEPASKEPWTCFIIADIDEESGLCRSITRHRWELEEESL